MRAADLEAVATLVQRVAAVTAGGVPLAAAWGYVGIGADRSGRDPAHGEAWSLCDAALDVAAEAGAPVAGVLARLASTLRDRAAALRAVDVALAAPRSTAKVVAVLPLVGIAFGMLLGLDPVGALLGSPVGLVALATGLALGATAWAWTRRIVRVASHGEPTAGLELELVAVALAGGVGVDRARGIVAAALRAHGVTGVDGTAIEETLRIAQAAGVPAAGLLQAEADAARTRERLAGQERAERASVRLVVPLGVCVLPAFGLLAIVPLVLTMLQQAIAPIA
ncbi:pilus assembly protein TadB [Agrococcus sp. SGAir0287]|uniref:pilus assembly protein TadB n=1 Tax=Agrococcus sp. SGAir0287 TaxID=2070347 RepID=UPI0010CD513E|nr:pilus assembly protein TadB [Agrococcus sp. SGAir0287]QCR18569.1 pilus assembly protein TadB [Agrococcus sp. SGAir0287]